MTIKSFPLDRVLPNPFQTREREDPEHIEQLKKSIREAGLLQTPIGRMSGEDVQLAFGHSRLAAFRQMEEQQYSTFPVDIRELSDMQMFELAVRENRDRKDLTPIEEAKAMQTYRDVFKKSTIEIGELFQITDSAVRNKIRLLGLPEDLQAAMGEHKISEGTAREMLVLFDLPEKLTTNSPYGHDLDKRAAVKELTKDALRGEPTDDIRQKVDNLFERYSEDLGKAPWKWDAVLEGKDVIGVCQGCEFKMERGKKSLCMKAACYKSKSIAWKNKSLAEASLKTGIPVLSEVEGEKFGYEQDHRFGYDKNIFPKIKKAGCENLRLIYSQREYLGEPQYLTKAGFKNVKIVCLKKDQFCTCLKALNNGLQLGKSGEDAKNAMHARNVQIRESRKREKEFCKAMIEEARKRLSDALALSTPGIWLLLLKHMNHGKYWQFESTAKAKLGEKKEQILQAVIEALLHDAGYFEGNASPTKNELNRLLKAADLPELDLEFIKGPGVSAETEGGK